jgi:hypothetical protein
MAIGSTLTPVGISTDKHYKHEQLEHAATWAIYHNLGKYPSVNAYFFGNTLIGKVNHISINLLELEFNTPCKGMAICN